MDPSRRDRAVTILDLLEARLDARPDEPLIERLSDGSWQPTTVRQFHDDVIAVAKGLIANEIESGDRVALMCRTRYEWTLLDYAIGAAGATSVPIYESSSPDQIRWICSDAGVKQTIVESRDNQLRAAQAIGHDADIWVIESGLVDTLRDAGAGVCDEEIARRREEVIAADIPATIVYTSGATGRPKGVVLTHGNFVEFAHNIMADQSRTSLNDVFNVPGRRLLLFLPLAHVLARFGQVFSLSGRTALGHCPDLKEMPSLLTTFKPTFVLTVPRMLEKVYDAAEASAGTGFKLRVFRAAAAAAVSFSEAGQTGRPSLPARLRHRVYDRLVYRSLRAAMGGAMRYLAVGGAPLNARLGHFFRGAGFTVLEGYGLTETTGSIFGNSTSRQIIGSVGLALAGVEVKYADDDEILVRGASVFHHYHNNPVATAAAFTADGWFRTGDIGRPDPDGYLHITGRKKDIIVTAGGKNVAPAPLEDEVRSYSLIDQVVVVGDGRKYIGAMVTVARDAIPAWARRHGLPADLTAEVVIRSQAARDAIRDAIRRVNAKVSRAEAIKRIAILATEFTEA
ncbi:MAG: AMP-dependent synthetase/ligase, partial [Actinomycetia bacterium]|nr:AMP-dependent synthetase/ligase [Actinomycetes bacterium]